MSENRALLIQKYNEQHGTAFRSITDIYTIEKSAPKAGKKLRVSETSIRNWVLLEGGKLNKRGGARKKKKPGLEDILRGKNKGVISQMDDVALAAYVGYHRSWVNVIRRRVGIQYEAD